MNRIRYYFGKKWLKFRDILNHDIAKFAKRQYHDFNAMVGTLLPYTGEIRGKRILDIGCGRLYPYTLLLHNLGNQVSGIDMVYTGVNTPIIMKQWEILKRNGFESFIGSLITGALRKDEAYYRELKALCDFPITTKGLDIRQIDAQNMDFQNETFDIAISITVFEHLSNVPQVVNELKRVMKSGGIVYIYVHLFTSPSGGHHFNWQNTHEVPPWDHLREKRLPLTVYLNGISEAQYLTLFRDKIGRAHV